jgi:hypothetical protein
MPGGIEDKGTKMLVVELWKLLLYIRARFRSWDLWVMGPPRFRCATLIVENFSIKLVLIQFNTN